MHRFDLLYTSKMSNILMFGMHVLTLKKNETNGKKFFKKWLELMYSSYAQGDFSVLLLSCLKDGKKDKILRYVWSQISW